MNARADDPISLGNLAAQILFLQSLTGLVSVALRIPVADVTSQISRTVSAGIDGLYLADAAESEQMREAARTTLAKIIEDTY